MTDRLTFRPTEPDRAHIAVLVAHLQAGRRSIFVSRSDVVRAALKMAAEAVAAGADSRTGAAPAP